MQKNSAQIRKQLISPKHLENPVVIEAFDDSVKPMKALAEKVEEIIGKIIAEYGEKSCPPSSTRMPSLRRER